MESLARCSLKEAKAIHYRTVTSDRLMKRERCWNKSSESAIVENKWKIVGIANKEFLFVIR